MDILIGIVGKPNSGKTTFLNAASLTSYKVADYPFTTIDAQQGVGYVRVKCVCEELGVKDNPQNSMCIEGNRFIPVNLLDVAGLVPDAWKGRGLGNQFLDSLRRADVLIHVVDASGSCDAEGRPVEPGSWNPMDDVKFLEREVAMWFKQIISKDWQRIVRQVESGAKSLEEILTEKLSGLAIRRYHVRMAVKSAGFDPTKPSRWGDDDLYTFSHELRKVSKPILICLNKIDRKTAKKNIEAFKKENIKFVAASALAEYFLRVLARDDVINYLPGDNDFEILKPQKLTEKQKETLEKIREEILDVYGSTGVQDAINRAVFDVLGMITVYPVEDMNKFTDHKGNVLPDALLVPKGTTVRELAYMIHTELGETFIYALDARTKQRLSEEHKLEDKSIIKIVSAKALR
ncbi:MAG: redox-regulated ATPase YchF [Candidatus Freyarchaeota archaeon]|nr:redox-regulated ATPase YchF [Candidatus Freyrarchaeum guaymaensis]